MHTTEHHAGRAPSRTECSPGSYKEGSEPDHESEGETRCVWAPGCQQQGHRWNGSVCLPSLLLSIMPASPHRTSLLLSRENNSHEGTHARASILRGQQDSPDRCQPETCSKCWRLEVMSSPSPSEAGFHNLSINKMVFLEYIYIYIHPLILGLANCCHHLMAA